MDSPIPAGGISITTSLRKDAHEISNTEPNQCKENNTEQLEFEIDQTPDSKKSAQLVKGYSAEGPSSFKSSPLESVSSFDQNSQQYSGKNKEYFENLQVCYDPENISISPSPLSSNPRYYAFFRY